MPEYKELERSLLARMLRTGIIDAPTFVSRAEALGYDPDDVFLMLRLEQSEAVKTVLRSTTFYSGSKINLPTGTYDNLSDFVDVTGFTYVSMDIYIKGNFRAKYWTGLIFYDAYGSEISRKVDPGSKGLATGSDRTETILLPESVPNNATQVKILIRVESISPGGGGIWWTMNKLEGVKL